jgi:hypothetical protein
MLTLKNKLPRWLGSLWRDLLALGQNSDTMKTEITLKSKQVFEAFCGGESLGTFEIASEWNGMAELRNKDTTLIVHRGEGLMRGLQGALGLDETVSVIKASPEMGAKILQANARALAQPGQEDLTEENKRHDT